MKCGRTFGAHLRTPDGGCTIPKALIRAAKPGGEGWETEIIASKVFAFLIVSRRPDEWSHTNWYITHRYIEASCKQYLEAFEIDLENIANDMGIQ